MSSKISRNRVCCWLIVDCCLFTTNQRIPTHQQTTTIDSLDRLSVEEQDYLVELIRQRHEQKPGADFWEGFQKFRATIEQEEIIFDDEDFANLRDSTKLIP